MYICKHFEIYELVDQKTYEQFGEVAWMFFNLLVLQSVDGLREFFNAPVTVNSWKWGGEFQFRGLRPVFYPHGAVYSQHRFGNAIDCDVKGLTAEEARTAIIANKDDRLLQYINCIEDDVSWLHFDCRNILNRIRVVKP